MGQEISVSISPSPISEMHNTCLGKPVHVHEESATLIKQRSERERASGTTQHTWQLAPKNQRRSNQISALKRHEVFQAVAYPPPRSHPPSLPLVCARPLADSFPRETPQPSDAQKGPTASQYHIMTCAIEKKNEPHIAECVTRVFLSTTTTNSLSYIIT